MNRLIIGLLIIFTLTVTLVCRVNDYYQKGAFGVYVEEVKHRTLDSRHHFDVVYYIWKDQKVISSYGFTNVPESKLDSLYKAQK